MGILRGIVKLVAGRSNLIHLCFTHGLTAGKTLDYVYENKSSGRSAWGRRVDRWFLRHPGWAAIRIRREHVEALLAKAWDVLEQNGKPVRLLDIASGPARYVLSVASKRPQPAENIRLMDIDERWLADAKQKAKEFKLTNVETVHQSSLDPGALDRFVPASNVCVSSGFYDWVQDDNTVRTSMALVHAHLSPGGFFVVTNQVSHPSQWMTEAIFPAFGHQKLKMKMRRSEDIEAWLLAAGFLVAETKTDPWGFYSVTLAQKKDV